MNDADKKRLTDNYCIAEEAMQLAEKIYDTYGEQLFYDFIYGDTVIHTLEKMKEIQKEIEDRILIDCSKDCEDPFGFFEILPNIELIFDDSYIIETMQKNKWIISYQILKLHGNPCFHREVINTFYLTGEKWEKCPEKLKKHLLRLKKNSKD